MEYCDDAKCPGRSEPMKVEYDDFTGFEHGEFHATCFERWSREQAERTQERKSR